MFGLIWVFFSGSIYDLELVICTMERRNSITYLNHYFILFSHGSNCSLLIRSSHNILILQNAYSALIKILDGILDSTFNDLDRIFWGFLTNKESKQLTMNMSCTNTDSYQVILMNICLFHGTTFNFLAFFLPGFFTQNNNEL